MNYLLGLVVSMSLGFLGVNLLRSKGHVDPLVHLIAGIGLGSAMSGHIIFYTLFIFGQYNAPAVAAFHWIAFGILVTANLTTFKKDLEKLCPQWPADRTAWLGLLVLSLLLIPLWREANLYPFGGWDAWACWNLKAKFIYLGGEDWKKMLDVSMWRSNNQYPFLLPLMNVWGWQWTKDVAVHVPMANAVLFAFLTALMMLWATKKRVNGILSVVPGLVLFTIPFVNTLSISQYSDIVLAFFLLGTLSCLIFAREDYNRALSILAGLFCGSMCFIKSEGVFAALIIAGLSSAYLGDRPKASWRLLGYFLTATVICALPAILFQLFWATPNVSFINGLTSAEHPVTFDRLKAIIFFLGYELISQKWNGLWVLLACGLLLARANLFKKGLGIVAAFLGIYLFSVLFFYAINTHYDILWWLGATLNRILYTILPLMVWWVFTELWGQTQKK